MKTTEFYSTLMKLMPSKYEEKDFREHLRYVLNEYKRLLNELNEADRPDKWNMIVDSVNYSCQAINDIVRAFYEGQHSLAYTKLRGLILNRIPQINIGISKDHKFYRMRCMENEKYISHSEMFHIPFNKRGSVKTQRYSMSGLPCLYICESVYGCWEEMGRPNLNQSFVSQLELQEKIHLIDLSYPDIKSWTAVDGKNRMHYELQRIPLILASMVKVKNETDVFKPEYIIPQLIMEFIVNRNNKSHDGYAIGVYYTSVHNNDDFHFEQSDMCNKLNNIAIPPQSTLKGKHCKMLCRLFTITNPTCDELEQAKTAGYQVNVKISNERQDCKYPYANSVFGQLESRLSNREIFPLHNMTYK